MSKYHDLSDGIEFSDDRMSILQIFRNGDIRRGEATEIRWGERFKLKIDRETHFSGGSSFYLGGAVFQGGRYLGGCMEAVGSRRRYYFVTCVPDHLKRKVSGLATERKFVFRNFLQNLKKN